MAQKIMIDSKIVTISNMDKNELKAVRDLNVYTRADCCKDPKNEGKYIVRHMGYKINGSKEHSSYRIRFTETGKGRVKEAREGSLDYKCNL